MASSTAAASRLTGTLRFFTDVWVMQINASNTVIALTRADRGTHPSRHLGALLLAAQHAAREIHV